ncbi:MAG: HvfC family RiPP maturation protein [Methylobacter sp.]
MSIDFRTKQLEFTDYIRNPKNSPPPADVQPERMAMYRELFFNNIDSFLTANFPVLRAILNDRQWYELAQDFFSKHRSQSPHFSEIPEEFLSYLQNERDGSGDFPFMLELGHYEWVEMALSIAKESVAFNSYDPDDLQNKRIRLSPLAWPLAYQYPVHKISPDFLPETAPDMATFLVVYRNPDDEVHFSEITPITYRLLEIVQEHDEMPVADCLKQVADEANHPNPDVIIAGGLQILQELAEKTVVVLA